jgi:hypothetical protein
MSDWDRRLLNGGDLRPLRPFNLPAMMAIYQMIKDWPKVPEQTQTKKPPARSIRRQEESDDLGW